MRLRFTTYSTTMMVALVAVAASAALLFGQAPAGGRGGAAPVPGQQGRGGAGAATASAIPRTAEGKPDFSGIWQVLDNSIDGNIEPHEASWGVHAGQGAIIDTPDGKIPYKPEAIERRNANYKNRAQDPVAHCWKPGVPRINYIPFPFEITQSPKLIQMTYEFVHSYRSVYLNDSKHLEGIDFFNGDSRAKWDGDTLVVDVTDFNDDPDRPTWLDASGNYHSDALHVEERYTFNGPDMITYRARLEDPKVYKTPFTIETVLYRHKEKNFRLLEYECQVFKEKLTREGKGNALRIVEGN